MNHRSNTNLSNLETLENRVLLAGQGIVQPLAEVDYYGDSKDWAINAVNAPEAWNQGVTGEGVLVAVVDSGVNMLHSDLVDRIWSNESEIPNNGIDDDANGYIDDIHGWDFVTDDAHPEDESGHGTRVAGVIVAARNETGATGIAYDAQVMPIRVLNAQGSGSQYDIAKGIRYAVDNGADVINLSLGALTGSQRLRSAVEHALRNDVLIVAAAGNAGENAPDFPAQYSGSFANVISVGAYDRDFDLAYFSNRVGSTGTIQIDAPGVSVYSTSLGNSFQYGSGTSYAAPVVSGVAALMLSASPDLSATDIRTHLVETADVVVMGTDSVGGANIALVVAAVLPAPNSEEWIPGDLDNDGIVGLSDFLTVSGNYNRSVQSRAEGDFNADGRVDFSDFLVIARNYGRSEASQGQVQSQIDAAHALKIDFVADSLHDELI